MAADVVLYSKCPVCGEVEDLCKWNICHGCGTEFGYDDSFLSHAELRERWMAAGSPRWIDVVTRGR
jgi:hypothetical protein